MNWLVLFHMTQNYMQFANSQCQDNKGIKILLYLFGYKIGSSPV